MLQKVTYCGQHKSEIVQEWAEDEARIELGLLPEQGKVEEAHARWARQRV